MGSVFKATQLSLQRTVACKTIRHHQLNHPEATARFEREARAFAALNHPNILQIFDVGHEGSLHYILMEYVEGPTLEELIEQGLNQRPEHCRMLLAQALYGLAYAHEHGVLHRDIKPANLLLRTQGNRLLLGDFGLAKLVDEEQELTSSGAILGTPAYMSPECLQRGQASPRSDLYSLGMTFDHVLSGKQPFQAKTPVATVWRVLQESLEPLRSRAPLAPADLIEVVEKMGARKPEDRFANCEEALDALGFWPDRYLQKKDSSPAQAWSLPAEGENLALPLAQQTPETLVARQPMLPEQTDPFADFEPDTATTGSSRRLFPWLLLLAIGLFVAVFQQEGPTLKEQWAWLQNETHRFWERNTEATPRVSSTPVPRERVAEAVPSPVHDWKTLQTLLEQYRETPLEGREVLRRQVRRLSPPSFQEKLESEMAARDWEELLPQVKRLSQKEHYGQARKALHQFIKEYADPRWKSAGREALQAVGETESLAKLFQSSTRTLEALLKTREAELRHGILWEEQVEPEYRGRIAGFLPEVPVFRQCMELLDLPEGSTLSSCRVSEPSVQEQRLGRVLLECVVRDKYGEDSWSWELQFHLLNQQWLLTASAQ